MVDHRCQWINAVGDDDGNEQDDIMKALFDFLFQNKIFFFHFSQLIGWWDISSPPYTHTHTPILDDLKWTRGKKWTVHSSSYIRHHLFHRESESNHQRNHRNQSDDSINLINRTNWMRCYYATLFHLLNYHWSWYDNGRWKFNLKYWSIIDLPSPSFWIGWEMDSYQKENNQKKNINRQRLPK